MAEVSGREEIIISKVLNRAVYVTDVEKENNDLSDGHHHMYQQRTYLRLCLHRLHDRLDSQISTRNITIKQHD